MTDLLTLEEGKLYGSPYIIQILLGRRHLRRSWKFTSSDRIWREV